MEISEFKEKYPNYSDVPIGSGAFSVCYLIDKNTVYKEYNRPLESYESLYKNMMKLKRLNFKNIIFPKETVMDSVSKERIIRGYLMPYISTCPADDITINNVYYNLLDLEKDIMRLSKKYSVLVDDVNPKNIIMNKSTISLIDTDLYVFDLNKLCFNPERENSGLVNYGAFKAITNRSLYDIQLYPEFPALLNKLLKEVIEGNEVLSTFFSEYIEYLEEYNEHGIKSVGELRRILEYK